MSKYLWKESRPPLGFSFGSVATSGFTSIIHYDSAHSKRRRGLQVATSPLRHYGRMKSEDSLSCGGFKRGDMAPARRYRAGLPPCERNEKNETARKFKVI